MDIYIHKYECDKHEWSSDEMRCPECYPLPVAKQGEEEFKKWQSQKEVYIGKWVTVSDEMYQTILRLLPDQCRETASPKQGTGEGEKDAENEYRLAPEESELIDEWRRARGMVKNSKFSLADKALEHCKEILGTSSDY